MASFARYQTNIPELDRVLGGGWVGGTLNYFLGAPGVGKSRLLYAASLLGSERSMFVSNADGHIAALAKRAYNWGIFQGNTRIVCGYDWRQLREEIARHENRPKVIYVDDYKWFAEPKEVHEHFLFLAKEAKWSPAIVLCGSAARSRDGRVVGMQFGDLMDASTVIAMTSEDDVVILEATKNRYAPMGGASLREPTMRFLRS
jgi:predicted ATP-dependent serine protease